MPQTFPPAWIRVAGNAAHIKANLSAHWRCFVHREPPVIPLEGWRLVGAVSSTNFLPGTAPTGDALGLNAWLDIYGRLTVYDKGIATIELLEPPEPN